MGTFGINDNWHEKVCHMHWPLTFNLALYLQGYLAVKLPILWIIFTCGPNTTQEGTMCVMYHFQGYRSMFKVIQVVQIFAVGAGVWQLISSFQDPSLAGSKAKFGTSPDIVKKNNIKTSYVIMTNARSLWPFDMQWKRHQSAGNGSNYW